MFDVVVVVYNRSLSEVPALSLAEGDGLVDRIIICDNSDDAAARDANSNLEKPRNVVYLNMGGNVGLPKAYNRALDLCAAPYACMFDDDTLFPDDYFRKVSAWLESNDADICVPVVLSQDEIISPCNRGRYRHLTIRSLDELSTRFDAINSGMCIARGMYRVCRYDENMFLDMVDFKFLSDARKLGARVAVMPEVRLEQNFSKFSYNETAERARYRIFADDQRYFFSGTLGGRVFAFLARGLRRLRLAVKYRSPGFMLLRGKSRG